MRSIFPKFLPNTMDERYRIVVDILATVLNIFKIQFREALRQCSSSAAVQDVLNEAANRLGRVGEGRLATVYLFECEARMNKDDAR